MALTDVRIRQAHPRDKAYRMADGGGLFIEVRPNGSKLWRYAYRIGGKQNLYALGAYPDVPLRKVREAHAAARALVEVGTNPAHARARSKGDTIAQGKDTFQVVADEWIDSKVTKENRPGWSPTYADQVQTIMDRDIFPYVRNRGIRGITSAEWLTIIRAIADRGAVAVAILARQLVSQVYAYAVTNLRADIDPTWPIRRAIVRRKTQHAKAQERDTLRDLMERLASYGGNRTTVIIVTLLMLTFVRTREARMACWSEFDLDGALWRIPEDRMKKGRLHLVPLSRQAVALLKELHEITGASVHLFPNTRRPRDVMSATTVNRALEHMGYPSGFFTGHDFRATAMTTLLELGFPEPVIDVQLAHAKKDKTRAAYNHAEFLADRTRMMQAWADWLDEANCDASPIRRQPGAKTSKRNATRRAR